MPLALSTLLIRLWFAVNAILALAPPLHWLFSGQPGEFLGLPSSLLYFLILALSITLNILCAYWDESARGELEA